MCGSFYGKAGCISIDGIIGTGLFAGSGSVINATGPGAILMRIWLLPYVTYATIAGIAIMLILVIFIDSMRSQLFLTMLISAGLINFFLFKEKTD